jgi:glycosyltransferase involved in cell wall biosynthesis
MTSTPSVLLVAGAYYPEISAAGLQCQAIVRLLTGRARVAVLATAVDPALPSRDVVDGVPVHRLTIDVRSRVSKSSATVRLLAKLARALPDVDVVHVHGFSQKNIPIALMASAMKKPVVLTLHTSGQDEPQVAAARGALSSWAFRSARLILPVSPNLVRRCEDAGIDSSHVRLTPNGIDVDRFRPASAVERASLRQALGWSPSDRVVLFVGFFSHDKRPGLLFRAWRRAIEQGVPSKLVYIGATSSPYFEIDRGIAESIRAEALAMGRASDVLFVDPTHGMERYYRAADVFVLSSVREANPVSLLEAMACGLPCVASRIDGATAVIVDDGVNGRLVAPDDEIELTRALTDIVSNHEMASRLGACARQTVVSRYDIRETADRWLQAYEDSLR